MKLKPCPFCGSEDLSAPKQTERYVACLECDTFGPSETVLPRGQVRQWDVARADIIDRWNTRIEEKDYP